MCCFQWFVSSHLPEDSCSLCCPCTTSWSGVIHGVTKTFGDGQRKSLLLTKCLMLIETSLLWSEIMIPKSLSSSQHQKFYHAAQKWQSTNYLNSKNSYKGFLLLILYLARIPKYIKFNSFSNNLSFFRT